MKQDNTPMTFKASDEQQQCIVREPLPFTVTETINSRTLSVYFNEEIVSARHYSKLLDMFRGLGPHDIVKLYINSPGGDLRTGSQLINAIRESNAYFITILDGMCYSLAPVLFLSGDNLHVGENSMMMFHDFSTGNYGKGNELFSSAEALKKYYKTFLKKYAYPFISEEEIEMITNGKDLYFDTNEIRKRLPVLAEYRKQLSEMAEETEEDLFSGLGEMDEVEIVDDIDEDEKASTKSKSSTKKKKTLKKKKTVKKKL